MKLDNNSVKANSSIRSKTILVIDSDGTKLGSMANFAAQKLAQEKGLDLIELSFNKNTDESVCKIGDLGKYLYERKKKEKEQQKIQRENQINEKEIQLRPNTDTHDLEIKAKKANEFAENGDRVKIILSMRHRELSHKDVGHKTITEFMNLVKSEFIEKPIHMEGNNFVATLFKKK